MMHSSEILAASSRSIKKHVHIHLFIITKSVCCHWQVEDGYVVRTGRLLTMYDIQLSSVVVVAQPGGLPEFHCAVMRVHQYTLQFQVAAQ